MSRDELIESWAEVDAVPSGRADRKPIKTLSDVRGMGPAEVAQRWDEVLPLLEESKL
jgi:hypothetical protein